jgi:subtilisin-like proprotein convertase family protein
MNEKALHRVVLVVLTLMAVVAVSTASAAAAPNPSASAAPVRSPLKQLSEAWNELQASSAAEQNVQRAWLLAQVSGAYKFHTELEQTTYQAPALTNVGRPAQVDQLYLEGRTDRPNRVLQMSMWQGGSVLKPADAIEMRVEEDKAYQRKAGGEWKEVDDFSGVFAPAQDPLGYLHGAKDIREVASSDTRFRQFSFAVDGAEFAEYMRGQLEDELRRSGKLPANITLDTARVYRDMIGTGELWLTGERLPLRLQMGLEFPQQPDGSRVKATIRTDFSNFSGPPARAYAKTGLLGIALMQSTPAPLANLAARLWLADWRGLTGALILVLVLVGLTVGVVALQRRRWVYAAVCVLTILSMVLVPLINSRSVFAFGKEQATARQKTEAEQARQQSVRDLQARLLNSWDATRDPLAAAEERARVEQAAAATDRTLTSLVSASPSPTATVDLKDDNDDGVPDDEEPDGCLAPDKGTDCDGDTLTNLQEYRLGTRLASADSDGDALRDDMEVQGFGETTKTQSGKWYSNPNSVDTNSDGMPDTQECWADETHERVAGTMPSGTPCDRHSDEDGVPDIFDQDNDGDGVDDSIDLSPFNVSTDVFDQDNPLRLQVTGLVSQPEERLFVDIQLVPTSPNQLSYARNVLDWPSGDVDGQVKRTLTTTFATSLSPSQIEANPSAVNGDMRLVPNLEIKIPASDAKNLLPKTQTLTTSRTVTGYHEVTTVSGDKTKTEEEVWLQAGIEFRASTGGTTVTFTTMTADVDRVQVLEATNCPVSPDAKPIRETPTTNVPWELDAVALPSIMDGNHVIVLSKGSDKELKTACLPLGDVANGNLDEGWMYDTATLDDYGVSVRDVADAHGAVPLVAAYVPVIVVTGRTGGEKQAFGARMPYYPGEGVTGFGSPQEVRLVWMVQLLSDTGDTQIIHTYHDERWKLAGMAARQDQEVRNAIFYQNPDSLSNDDGSVKKLHSRLTQVALLLSEHFMAGTRSQARLTWTSGTKPADLVEELRSRAGLQDNLPSDSINVRLVTYRTQDEVARIAQEETSGILNHFVDNNAYKTGYSEGKLLFAREEVYQSASWGQEADYELELPGSFGNLVSYSLKPFQYRNGTWEARPITDHLDLYRLEARAALTATNPDLLRDAGDDRPAVLEGMAVALQSFELGLIFGDSRVVKVPGQNKEVEDPNPAIDKANEIVNAGTGQLLGAVAAEVIENIVEPMLTKAPDHIKLVVETLANTGKAVLGEKLTGKLGFVYPKDGRVPAQARMSIACCALATVVFAVTIGAYFASEQDANTMYAVVGVLNVVMGVLSVAMNVMDVLKAVKDAGGGWNGLKAALSANKSVSRATAIGAAVAFVLAVIGAVVMFAVTLALGGPANNIAGAAVATMLAAVTVAILMLVIALIPIVGQVIVAVIALLDAFIAGVCAVVKAAGYDLEGDNNGDGKPDHVLEMPGGSGAKITPCSGISGILQAWLTFQYFSSNVLVGNMTENDRIATSNMQFGMIDTADGFQEGNAFKPSVRVADKIELIRQPVDWKSALYFWQLNWDLLDNATHRFDLTLNKDDRGVSLKQMQGEWNEMGDDGTLKDGHRSPGIQYRDPLHMEPATAKLEGDAVLKLGDPGINRPAELYLREAYANPTQECIVLWPTWIPLCYIRANTGTNHVDMKLRFDVLPATLDKFHEPWCSDGCVSEKGVSLAWGQEGEVRFPVMRDFDGDGLVSQAVGGNDPDDRFWDTDGDGMSDLFELQNGVNPQLKDSDDDGLDDRQELILGTNPGFADSDGDGLKDGEEVFHVNPDGTWRGGWRFVYELTDGAEQATWVTSDAKEVDGDGDTLTDYQEWLYGLNPGVKSDPTILELESLVREAKAPSMLLRLEERAGADLFGDTSGLLNNASCTGTSCPKAGHEGRYTNGLVFDGDGDALVITSTVGLADTSFTVAAWVKRDAGAGGRYVFSTGTGETRHGLQIGFNSHDRFVCGFSNDDLATDSTYPGPDQEWHHWACTYDATTRQRTIYRDGAPVGRNVADGSFQGSGPWHIGVGLDMVGYYKGKLDEVAVIPAALASDEIKELRDARYNPGGAQVRMKPGEKLTYEATLTNNLLGKQLTGLLDVHVPDDWSSIDPVTYRLEPAGTGTITGTVTVPNSDAAASGAYSLTLTAGAAASDPVAATSGPPLISAPEGARLHLAFEDNYLDTSGNGNDATGWGGTTFSRGFRGQAVELNTWPDGTQYLALPRSVADTVNFTFAAWVYWRNGPLSTRIIDIGQSGGDSMALYLSDNPGHLAFVIRKDGGNPQKIVGMPFPRQAWTHVAITLLDNVGTLYMNGEPVGFSNDITIDPIDVNGGNASLGGSQAPYFHGMMDEVFIYHRALSPQEIDTLVLSGVTEEDDLARGTAAAYFPFEGHYLDYHAGDSGPSANNAIPAGATEKLSFVGGINGQALNLGGDSGYVDLPASLFEVDGSFSFAAWVYWRGGGDWQRIFDFGSNTDNCMYLTPWDNQGEMEFHSFRGGSIQWVGTADRAMPQDKWTHVAFVLDSTLQTGTIYINGEDKTKYRNLIDRRPSMTKGQNNWLGRSMHDNDPYFNGVLDDVYIFHDALTKEEIADLMVANAKADMEWSFDSASNPLANSDGLKAAVRAGSPQYDRGVDGRTALRLDGGTALEMNSPSFDVSDSDFSYVLWVKPEFKAGDPIIQAVFGQPPVDPDWRKSKGGPYLELRSGTDLRFGWGGGTTEALESEWVTDALGNETWNHIAVTYDKASKTIALYANGRERLRQSGGGSSAPRRLSLDVGTANSCALFSLRTVLTEVEGDAWGSCDGSPAAEYTYEWWDKGGWWRELVYDDSADSGDWEPGDNDGPVDGDWWKDRDGVNVMFCGDGGGLQVVEQGGGPCSDSHLSPRMNFDLRTRDRRGWEDALRYGTWNTDSFRSPVIAGDGHVRYWYEIYRDFYAFTGVLDNLRLYHRRLSEEEVGLLYAAMSVPYHFTLDDPPGAGRNASRFNFRNQGSIVDGKAEGMCEAGACPTSGLPGRVNQAVLVRGNQSIQISNLDLPMVAPGFSMWVKPLADGRVLRIDKVPPPFGIEVKRKGRQFCISTSQDWCTPDTEHFESGEWHHLAVRFDPGVGHLYVNGTKQASAPYGAWGGAGSYKVILGGGFSGMLDDFRIAYDGSEEFVKRMMYAAPIVSLHLQESDRGVTSFADVGGGGATCVGDGCPTAGVKGKVSHAARFDGIDDGLVIPDGAKLDLTNLTVATWVRPASGSNRPGRQVLVAKADDSRTNYALYMTDDRRIVAEGVSSSAVISLTSDVPIALDQYSHVAATYNGRELRLYINGIGNAAKTTGSFGSANNERLAIGKRLAGGDASPFRGDLDEIQIYNYALFAYEVKDIYAFQANWIEEENAYDVYVDSEPPTSELAEALPSHFANNAVQMGVTASDLTSAVTLLELGVKHNGVDTWTAGEACQDARGETATGSPAWCPWFRPDGEGRYELQTRATDAVGNREAPTRTVTILVDATGPVVTAVQANNSLQALRSHPTEADVQVLALNGTVNDLPSSGDGSGSGIEAVSVTLRNADGKVVGEAPYPAVLTAAGPSFTWILDYPLNQADVAGMYRLEVTGTDKVGNSRTLTHLLHLDGTAPGVEMDEVASGLPLTVTANSAISTTTTLRGVVSERPYRSGAVAVYHFEEAAGANRFANAADSSGWVVSGDATCGGGKCPTNSPGREGLGSARSFDGVDDEIIGSDPSSLANAPFTVALWASRGGPMSGEQVAFGSDPDPNGRDLRLGFDGSNRFLCAIGDDVLTTSATYTDAGKWHHWTCTYEGNGRQRTIYLDGAQVAQDTAADPFDGRGSWHIGSRSGNRARFKGMLDEVAVYDRALSADDVRVLAAPGVKGLGSAAVSFTPLWADPESGMVSPYLDESIAGQTLHLPLDDTREPGNLVSYRNLADPDAAASCTTCPESGTSSPGGAAVDFDGKDEAIGLPGSVTQTDDFTFAAWVYWRGEGAGERIFDLGQDTTHYMALTSAMAFTITTSADTQVLTAQPLPIDTWVHVAVTLEGDTGKLYVNGVETTSGNIALNPRDVAGASNWLGRSQDSQAPHFNGRLSDVRAFSRALGEAEIQSLCRGTRALLVLPMDEAFVTGGSTLPNTSAWGRTATLDTGAGDTANKAVPGIVGPHALRLDGTDDLAKTPETAPLANASFTVAAWVKRDAGGERYVFSSGTGQPGESLRIGFNAGNGFVCGFGNNDLTTSATYTDVDWHQWACTYDAFTGLRTIYRDGVQVAQGPASANYRGSGDWYIGSGFDGQGRFGGELDDMRVYPRSLAGVEVADLAHANWRTATMDPNVGQSNWSLDVPDGLEGVYRLDLRGVDAADHYSFNGQGAALNQTVDSLPPRATLTQETGTSWGPQYHYVFTAEDMALSLSGLSTPCDRDGTVTRTYRLDPAGGLRVLSKLVVECTLNRIPNPQTAVVLDAAGNRSEVNPEPPATPNGNTFEFTNLPAAVGALDPVTITGQVKAPSSLTGLTIAVSGSPVLTGTYPGLVGIRAFEAPWTPQADGVYPVTAQATDSVKGPTEIESTLLVDTSRPEATIASNVFTGTAYSPFTGIRFSGVVSDTMGVISATAQLNLGGQTIPLGVRFDDTSVPTGYFGGQAMYISTTWRANWLLPSPLPDGVTGTLSLTTYDATGIPETHSFPITVDLVTPRWGGETEISADGAPITTSLTYRSSPLDTVVRIPRVVDGSPVTLWYGWTNAPTATRAELTQVVGPSVPLMVEHGFILTVPEGGVARFFHLRATDDNGNERTEVFGPYYHDLPGMPDYISTPKTGDGFTPGVYRGWQANGCALLGVDQRIPSRNPRGAALSSAQSLHLTWNHERLHFVWQRADWESDGDLFIYLDTIPDRASPSYQQVGSGAAYNPYTSTQSSTVLLLPTEEWSRNPNAPLPPGGPKVNGMHADFALWVKSSTEARLLRWVDSQWVDDGNLNALDGVYWQQSQTEGTVTDVVVPLSLVGNPQNWVAPYPGFGPAGMGVVAMAVDAEEGPSGGLRLWSVLPYANPADSARVVSGAPAADEPHLLMLTDRYVVPVTDGTCFEPEARPTFYLTASADGFTYDGFDDETRLKLPAPSVRPDAWDGLFDPYDDAFRAWLNASYCPTHPTYPACRADKPPAELSARVLLGAPMEGTQPPLQPGSPVTYTLYYVNPTGTPVTTVAYLYSNDKRNDPQNGIAFTGQPWLRGCPGWLSLELQPGAGHMAFAGTVQPNGVSAVTLDIAPSYHLGATGCSIEQGDGSWPAQRLTVQHTPEDGPPAYVSIRPEFTTAGPVTASIPGLVQDASPVSQIAVRVDNGAPFACTDATPTDGQWSCPWDVRATNGGTQPADGTQFSLRAQATDAFGNSTLSHPRSVRIDAQPPVFEGASGIVSYSTDRMVRVTGGVRDNIMPGSVELCDSEAKCSSAGLTLDPDTVPRTTYSYTDTVTTPATINASGVCDQGLVGLQRTFNVTDRFAIGSLEVGLRVSHSYRSDLSATLSHAGTSVSLFSFTENVLAENINGWFTDQSLARLVDDLSGHDLQVAYSAHIYRPQVSLAAFDGQDAGGTWTLTLCDRDPGRDIGAYHAAELQFASATAPSNGRGDWSFSFDATGSDNKQFTWQAYATDVNGNLSTQPHSVTVQVDNVGPVITANQIVAEVLVGTLASVLTGTTTDGSGVDATWVRVVDPLGDVTRADVVGDASGWTFSFSPTVDGTYRLTVMAADRMGNQVSGKTFDLIVHGMLDLRETVMPQSGVSAGDVVTYTITVANHHRAAMNNLVIGAAMNRWLTVERTPPGVSEDSTGPEIKLNWGPIPSLAPSAALSFTVTARMPEDLVFEPTAPMTGTVDLRGMTFSSVSGVTTDNLGASQAKADFEVALEADRDADGVADFTENGAPNGGDGNVDGTADKKQSNVVSLHNAVDAAYMTLVAPVGTRFANVMAVREPPSGITVTTPSGVLLPVGLVGFELAPIPAPPVSVTLSLLLEKPVPITQYWRWGPEPANATDHYYRFDPRSGDPLVGATIMNGQKVELTFVDGARGDDDLKADGVLVDQGGPGFRESPTAVNLTSLTATARGRVVRVAWETGSEVDVLGFNVLRTVPGRSRGEAVNRELITATDSAARGGSYVVEDRPGIGWHDYTLEVVNADGTRETYGPARVRIGPTWRLPPPLE